MGYKLPKNLRKSFREPIGPLFTGKGKVPAANAIKYILHKKINFSVAVGDFCAKSLIEQKFYPDIVIFDGKTHRTSAISFDLGNYQIWASKNPKEWILRSAWETIENAIAFSTSNKCRIAVRIEGEEDLLIIPVIISLPLRSIVIYGQPEITTEEGIVVAEVTPTLKKSISDTLKKFEFKSFHEE